MTRFTSALTAIVLCLLTEFLSPTFLYADSGSSESSRIYSYYGKTGISSLLGWNGKTGEGASVDLSGELFLDMSHRFTLPRGGIFIHHLLTETFSSDPAGLPRFSLYEGYIRLIPAQWLTVSLGRHRISWGNGLLLSPSDSFQPSSLSGTGDGMPVTERDNGSLTGYTGVGAQIYPTPNISLSLGASLDDVLDSGKVSLSGTKFGGIAWFLTGPFEYFLSGVYQKGSTARPGAGISVDLFGVLLRAEAGLEFLDQYQYPVPTASGISLEKRDTSGPHPEISAGIEKTFHSGDLSLSLDGEYLFLSRGYSQEEESLLLSYPAVLEGMRSASPPAVPELLGKHYMDFLISLGIGNKWEAENLLIVDITGPSLMGSHTFSFYLVKGITLKAGCTWMGGEDNTEFGSSPRKIYGTLEGAVNF